MYGDTPEEKLKIEAEDKLFSENIQLILCNSDIFLEDEKYFYCKFGSTYVSMPYIAGGGLTPLGILISLWKEHQLLDKCKKCGGNVYIIGAGGSPLSGKNNFWGYCSKCGQRQRGQKETFGSLWHPIGDMKKKFPKKGKIPAISLEELIEELKNFPNFNMGDSMIAKKDLLKRIVNKFYVLDTVARNFTDNANFVLDNTHIISGKPIWKFSWHPFCGELLFDIEPINHKTMIKHFQYRFEEYLRGIYIAEQRVVLFRPYYNSFISQDYDEELSHKIMEACQSALGGEELVKYIWDIDNRYLIERFGNRGW